MAGELQQIAIRLAQAVQSPIGDVIAKHLASGFQLLSSTMQGSAPVSAGTGGGSPSQGQSGTPVAGQPSGRGNYLRAEGIQLNRMKSEDKSKGPFDRFMDYFEDPSRQVKKGELKESMGEGGKFEQILGRLSSDRGTVMTAGAGQALQETNIPGVSQAGKFVEHLGKAADRLQTFSNHLHDSNMQFAQYSGEMAVVQAEQQVREIRLAQERGGTRADSARYLAEGKSELAQTFAPLEDFGARLKNYVFGAADRVVSFVGSPLKFIGDKANGILDYLEGKDAADSDAKDFLDAGDKHWVKDWGKPSRFTDQI